MGEHSIIGGLGSAVAEFVAEEAPGIRIKRIGFEDTFSILGKYENILRHYQLHPAGIAEKVLRFHERLTK